MTINLPKSLLRGTISARCIGEFIRNDEDNARYDDLFQPGQKRISRFFLPPFQRPPVWTVDQQRKLIESLWLDLPIGSIIANGAQMKMVDGKFPITADWLIDGQQRLRAILAYVRDGLRVFIGTEAEHGWDELSSAQKRGFELKPIGYIELHSVDEAELREVYNRLCFGGTPHDKSQHA